jgi:hypothetical protein
MAWREIILLVCGLVVAAALTIFGTAKFVDWIAPSDPYGGGVKRTGKMAPPNYPKAN